MHFLSLQGIIVYHVPLLRHFVYFTSLQGPFVYYVPLQGLLVHPCASIGSLCLLYVYTMTFVYYVLL